MNMLTMGFRSDEEEEKDDEDAAIGDDALEEISDDFAEDGLEEDADPLVAVTKDAADEEDDEEDVDFDTHDDVDPI